jgi:hypothetical protein
MNLNIIRVVLVLFWVAVFYSPTALKAQRAGAFSPADQAASSAKAQAVFNQYKIGGRRASTAEEQLIKISNFRLPRTDANLTDIRAMLAATADLEEKKGLIRLLAEQYERTGSTYRNGLIVHDLKVLANSSDKGVARAATFSFTRLGFLPGFEDLLRNALKASVISVDEYFGEVAHVVALAPANDQGRLAHELRQSRNMYASEIVAMGVNSAYFPSTWTNETRGEIGLLFESTEPTFPEAKGLYDLAVAVQYSNWLNALAVVRSSVLNKEGAEFIFSKLNDPSTDPRKVIAFLSSEYAPRTFQLVGERARFLVLYDKISTYSKQHPQNREMSESVSLVSSRLAQLTK